MSERIQALGKRAYVVPFLAALVIFCMLGLAIAPMMHMAPKDMPVAIVNLDEGAELPSGEKVVAGDIMVERLQEVAADASEDGGEAPMAFTMLDSTEELDAAMEAGEYYGALVIPADFTEQQMAGQVALASTLGQGISEMMAAQQQAAAAGGAMPADPAAAQAALAQQMQGIVAEAAAAQASAEKPTVELIVDTAKSPLFAQTLQQGVGTALTQQGINVEVTSIGEAEEGASPISGILGIQMMVMPLFIMSMVMSIMIVLFKWPLRRPASRAEKGKIAGAQVAFMAVASLVAAVLAYGIIAWIGGIDVPATAILLLWLASFCMMLAFVGLCDLALPFGVLVMVCIFALGMGTAVLAPEMMPPFWANWVAPWAPQAGIGEGLRNIIYLNGGAFDVGTGVLIAWGCVGLVALLLAVAVPSRKLEAKAE